MQGATSSRGCEKDDDSSAPSRASGTLDAVRWGDMTGEASGDTAAAGDVHLTTVEGAQIRVEDIENRALAAERAAVEVRTATGYLCK